MADIERIKDRIRKLFRVAEDDAASQGEIDNAMRAAQALLYAHQLDEAELMKDDTSAQREARMNRYGVLTVSTYRTLWEITLAHFLCDLFGTIQWYFERGPKVKMTPAGLVKTKKNGKPEFGMRFYFYGLDEDAKLASEMFEELGLLIMTSAKLRTGDSALRKDGKSYATGFVDGMKSRIEKVQIEMKKDSTGTALVVQQFGLQCRKEGVSWLAKEKGVVLRTGSPFKSRGRTRKDGYEKGFADGKSYDPDNVKRKKLTNE